MDSSRRNPDQDAAVPQLIDDAGRQLRAPWAASIAGLLFAVLFSAALVLLRSQSPVSATDAELANLYAGGGDLPTVVGGLYLAPIAGVMFLWFVAVIRDQLGEREDRFFATVFFGSGLIFVALMFAAVAVVTVPSIGVRYLDQAAPTASTYGLLRALAYAILFGFATRVGAVFLIATSTIGLRSRVIPRWFALAGYAFGLLLLVVTAVWDWIILGLPVWVGIVSLYILRQERRRSRSDGAGTAG